MSSRRPRSVGAAFSAVVWICASGAADAQGGGAVDPALAIAAAERQDRMEELEFIIRQITAENERLQADLRSARAEVERLQRMTSDLAAVQQAMREAEAAQAGGEASAPPLSAAGPSQAAPDAPALAPAPGAADPFEAARAAATGTLGTLPAEPADAAAAAAAYARARELLFGSSLPEAKAAFEAYLEQYPEAADAPDARYWRAFILLGMNDYRNAALGFSDYLERHGADTGPRAQGPAALVRLGIALAGAGLTQDACAALRDLPRRYPNAPQAIRNTALEHVRLNNCPTR